MISVIICCSNFEKYTQFCLPILEETDRLLKSFDFQPLEFIIVMNPDSIFKGYNTGLSIAKNSIKVFMHQDVNLLNPHWALKLIRAFSNPEYGLIGFVGTKKLPHQGFWWESGKEYIVGELYSGAEKADWVFNRVNMLTEVECVDGFFMATNRNIKFDEVLKGFHFYDMDYSRTLRKEGLKVGVLNHKVWHIGAIRNQDTSIYLEAYNTKWR